MAITKNSATIGWRNEPASIVSAHMNKRKYQVGGITIKEQKALLDEFDLHFNRQWNRKTRDVSVTVKI